MSVQVVVMESAAFNLQHGSPRMFWFCRFLPVALVQDLISHSCCNEKHGFLISQIMLQFKRSCGGKINNGTTGKSSKDSSAL